MNDQTDFRQTWRQNWLHCIREFADSDLQRRMWLDPENHNPHWSYVEFMCTYFNDTLYGKQYDWAIAEGLVTKQEAAELAALHQQLRNHSAPEGDDLNHKRILEDPAWLVIVAEAKLAVAKLSKITKDPAERAILLSDRAQAPFG